MRASQRQRETLNRNTQTEKHILKTKLGEKERKQNRDSKREKSGKEKGREMRQGPGYFHYFL